MGVNKALPHVLVLPEDDANLRLANEFHTCVDWPRYRQMQVLPVAGGWSKVLDQFESVHVTEMNNCQCRFMVLLIDFDGDRDRLQRAKNRIPEHLLDRVFVLGAWSTPEALKNALGSYETIGSDMATDCREGTDKIWTNGLLRHNATEIDRLREHVRPILFSPI